MERGAYEKTCDELINATAELKELEKRVLDLQSRCNEAVTRDALPTILKTALLEEATDPDQHALIASIERVLCDRSTLKIVLPQWTVRFDDMANLRFVVKSNTTGRLFCFNNSRKRCSHSNLPEDKAVARVLNKMRDSLWWLQGSAAVEKIDSLARKYSSYEKRPRDETVFYNREAKRLKKMDEL